MRLLIIVLGILGFCCGGCTHKALQRRTVAQASTLTDLQYQQVLDNLAMFRCNRAAMPWHAKLSGGVVSVTDQGTGAFETEFPGEKLLFNAERGILAQWDIDPAVEADDLVPLALAYERAANPEIDEMLGELQDRIRKKICEIAVRFDVLPSQKTLRDIFESEKAIEKIREQQCAVCDLLGNAKRDLENLTKRSEKQSAVCSKMAELRQMQEEHDKEETKPERRATLAADIKKWRSDLQTLEQVLEENPVGVLEACKDLDPEVVKALLKERHQTLTFRWLELEETLRAVKSIPKEGQPSSTLPTTVRIDASPMMAMRLDPQRIFVDASSTSGTKLRGMTEDERLLFALHLVCDEKYHPPAWVHEPSERNVGLVAQAEGKIESLQKLLDEPAFFAQWFGCGSKKDIPKCACYVGHYCGCGCDCYVWVEPQHMETLKALTLIVLDLAPTENQDTFPRSAGYSPTLSRSR